MSASKISHRYAQAFYEEASHKGNLEKVLEDMVLVSETLKKTTKLSDVLYNPSLASVQKFDVLQGVFSKHVDPQTLAFIEFVASKKRVYLLQGVAEEIGRIHRQRQGIFHLKVRVSPGLGEDFSKKLVDKLTKVTGHKFDTEVVEDESLQGGFVYSYQGKMFDYSISGGLNSLVKTLSS